MRSLSCTLRRPTRDHTDDCMRNLAKTVFFGVPVLLLIGVACLPFSAAITLCAIAPFIFWGIDAFVEYVNERWPPPHVGGTLA